MARVEDAGDDSVYTSPSSSARSKTRSASHSRVCHTKQEECVIWDFSLTPLQSICVRAMRVQVVVLKNAAVSIIIAWLTGGCYSLGNIFSGKSLRVQSRDELIVTNSVWAGIAFCTAVLVSFLPLMVSLRFIKSSDHIPTAWFCLKRLVRASVATFVWVILSNLGFGYFAAYFAHSQPHTFKYKMECYLDNVSLLGFFTGISRAVKKIYYEETLQGQARLAAKLHGMKSTLMPSSARTSAVSPEPVLTTKVCYRPPSFWRAYIRNVSSGVPALLATGFVHGLSRQRIIDRGSGVVTGFVVGSIVFKLAIQELVKYYIMRKHVLSTRTMCVIVGIPTVLIDTQARIILLGISNKRIAATGSLAMAIIEVSLRVGKAKFVRWSISRRERKIWRKTAASSRQSSTPRSGRPTLSAMHVEFEVWYRQVQVFHTAELTADMYAEYIAIGCSASILFFYCGNPHYSLLRRSNAVDMEMDVAHWRTSHLYLLAFQVGVEIVVDYVSIVLELTSGIEFDHIQNLDSFLAALFMVTAVINMIISIGVYLN